MRPSALGGWRTVAFKERPGGLVYGLYADQAGGRPLGEVFIGSERSATGTAALPLNAWTHLATTYDGSFLRLYVNGVLASSTAVTGAMAASTGVLRLGGNSVWGEWFAGLIDEVRVYDRALTRLGGAAGHGDGRERLAAAAGHLGSLGAVWSVGVDRRSGRRRSAGRRRATTWGSSRYNVHRSQTSGFTPAAGNRIAQPTGTSYTDSGLAAGTYYYRVTAEDAAGNVSGASAQVTAVVPADQPPGVSVTAPASGATLSGTVSVERFRLGRRRRCGRPVPARCGQPRQRGHLRALFRLLGHDERQQRQLLDHRRRPRQRRPDHHLHGRHRHRQQRAADCRSRRGLRIQRRLGLDRRRLVRRRQHGVRLRRDLERCRPVRLGAQLRRRQRLGDDRGRELARPDERDDARGVGAALGARWLADGGLQGASGRGRLRVVRRPGGRRGRSGRCSSARSGTRPGRRRCR